MDFDDSISLKNKSFYVFEILYISINLMGGISHFKISHIMIMILILYSVSHADFRNSEENKLTKF